jgi:hypothetical protein
LLDNQGDFIHVPHPRAPIPWPNYDTTPADEIAGYMERLGLELGHVLAYEAENANREEVIEAINEIGQERTESGDTIVQA